MAKNSGSFSILFLTFILLASSCKKEDKSLAANLVPTPSPDSSASSAQLNQSAFAKAQDYYLWNTQLPASFNASSFADPNAVMTDIRQYSREAGFATPVDRWSFAMKKLFVISALSIAALSVQAKDIVDTAVGAGTFNTLATALKAAGLVDTLKGPGPFTVFAPTDAAFAKVPKAQLDALLADKAKLTAVLTYHVLPGKVMAANVKAGKVKTVQGSELTVTTDKGVMVDGAKVTATDIVADNGVIHVIDTVIMPK